MPKLVDGEMDGRPVGLEDWKGLMGWDGLNGVGRGWWGGMEQNWMVFVLVLGEPLVERLRSLPSLKPRLL